MGVRLNEPRQDDGVVALFDWRALCYDARCDARDPAVMDQDVGQSRTPGADVSDR